MWLQPAVVHISQKAMLFLTDKGVSRELAYSIVQRCAMIAIKQEKDFRYCLQVDKDAKKYISADDINKFLSPESYVKYVKYTFDKVFG